jgi:hypothetical protein
MGVKCVRNSLSCHVLKDAIVARSCAELSDALISVQIGHFAHPVAEGLGVVGELQALGGDYAKACSRPLRKSFSGRSMPIKTILLLFFSPWAHTGPKSEPMS